jgi:serine O-acetyltransferase
MLTLSKTRFGQDIRRIIHLHEWSGLSQLQLLFFPGFWAAFVYRFGNYFTTHNIPVIKPFALAVYFIMKMLVEVLWGISISRHAKIGGGLFINHFCQIFIHGDVQMGENCIVSQGVTVGVKGDTHSGAPKLGDGVVVAAGAKVLGPITIGDNVTVGANAVAVKDIPANQIWGGVPATFIRESLSPD